MFRNRKKNKENKITERALYASLFSMVLCCAMLLETTYAWFTQEINTGVAVIQTGEMSVELVVENGVVENEMTYAKASAANLIFKAEDTTALQTASEGSGEQTKVTVLDMAKAAQDSGVESITYFEPGGTYYLPPIYVKNTGNIDLKYMVTVSFAGAQTTSVAETTEDGNSDATPATASETTEADSATKATVDLRNVIGFKAFSGTEENGQDLIAVDNTETVTTTENSENAVTETVTNPNNIFTGELKAGAISEPIVIQASMLPDMGIDCANLKLDGIQIIVTATQITASNDELFPKSTGQEAAQNSEQ